MTCMDRSRLLKLCLLVAPFLLTACTQRDAVHASAETSSAEASAASTSKLQEVVITASRTDTGERRFEEDRRTLAN